MHTTTHDPGAGSGAAMDYAILRRQALEDSPAYVELIARTLASSILELRAGRLAPGFELMANALDDMQQFVELCRLLGMGAVSQDASTTFIDTLRRSIGRTERLMVPPIDVEALATHIEQQIAPVLECWIDVYDELAADIGGPRAER
ncbi:MAG: hypothetical protein KC503_42845 [Myxococcales bacterium]|nr:hypothetical protein [Myxococcales bacterium]